MLERERRAQQRIGPQIDLPDREIVRRAPVGVEQSKLVVAERVGGGLSKRGRHGDSCNKAGWSFRVRIAGDPTHKQAGSAISEYFYFFFR